MEQEVKTSCIPVFLSEASDFADLYSTVQECDATMFNSYSAAGYIKIAQNITGTF